MPLMKGYYYYYYQSKSLILFHQLNADVLQFHIRFVCSQSTCTNNFSFLHCINEELCSHCLLVKSSITVIFTLELVIRVYCAQTITSTPALCKPVAHYILVLSTHNGLHQLLSKLLELLADINESALEQFILHRQLCL